MNRSQIIIIEYKNSMIVFSLCKKIPIKSLVLRTSRGFHNPTSPITDEICFRKIKPILLPFFVLIAQPNLLAGLDTHMIFNLTVSNNKHKLLNQYNQIDLVFFRQLNRQVYRLRRIPNRLIKFIPIVTI